tara:strand:- start:831 stop:1100 length:270 start_codon:yes stop_codon:yes gene_type:complete
MIYCFLSNPPLYFHPATWGKPLIPHGHYEGLPPQGQLVVIILGLLFFLVGYGIYLTFGSGGEDLKDAIDEHAKMHELGVAHGHNGRKLK